MLEDYVASLDYSTIIATTASFCFVDDALAIILNTGKESSPDNSRVIFGNLGV